MRKFLSITALTALATTAPLSAQDTEKPKMLSPAQIVDRAAPEKWKTITASDLLVMDLKSDAKGKERKIVIQLMPPPFSQGWVRNIRKLAKEHWWDGTSINRVQDNYVVQWGDASEKKILPAGLAKLDRSKYQVGMGRIEVNHEEFVANSVPTLIIDYKLKSDDSYAPNTGFRKGWPLAYHRKAWPIHCYGAVGVGRGYSPDTGSGAELYTVIGHAPRHLDRNIAVVGRIIEGIEHLSSLPRGTGPLGFYEKAELRVPIQSIKLASELPYTDQPRFEYLSTRSKSFRKYVNARSNRRDPFFIKPAGGADICNIPVPVRRVKAE